MKTPKKTSKTWEVTWKSLDGQDWEPDRTESTHRGYAIAVAKELKADKKNYRNVQLFEITRTERRVE